MTKRMRTLKIAAAMVLLCAAAVAARAQDARVGVPTGRMRLSELIARIESQTPYLFVMSDEDIDGNATVSLQQGDATVAEILSRTLPPIGLRYSFSNNYISLQRRMDGPDRQSPQGRPDGRLRVTGTVRDRDGQPVVGAGVFIPGTATGTTTDEDGNWSLLASEGDALTVSMIGYEDRTVSVGGDGPLHVTVEESADFLEETVVIGYGTVRKSSLTGALSQVSGKSFAEQRVTRIDQALQGRAAGVQVTSTSGAPGSEVRIRIRGANSILGDNSPLFVIDGFVGADYNDLNPNDVESMEVLKDAASTAIYGSRGANGVILVTTKKGAKDGKVSLNYEGSVSVSNIIKKYDLLDAGEFAVLANEHAEAMGSQAIFTQAQIEQHERGGGFDYQDAVLRTGFSHQHQLSVSSGNDKTQYRVSGNYLSSEGIIKESSYERYTVRANLNTKINDRLQFRFTANGAVGLSNKTSGAYSGASNVLTQALAWSPVTNPYTEDGGYATNDPYGSVKGNPIAMLYDTESVTRRTNVNVMGGVAYEILDGLKLDFQAGADLTYRSSKSWSGDYITQNKPSASKTESHSDIIQTTTQLSFDRDFGKHSINAVAAFETQSYQYESLYGSASELKFTNLKYDNLAQAGSNTVSSSYSMWSLLSYLGRVNYGYDNRYLASVSLRRDGSSKFADGNKFSTFPSMSLAWNAHNEAFVKGLDLFSTLKVRLSWGYTGSQAISSYATLSAYSTSSQYYSFTQGGQTAGIVLGSPGNPALKWETTQHRDVGLEMGFWDDRLKIDVDYYWKQTDNLLMNKSIPEYQGGGSITSNIGAIRNTGLDITISGDIISTRSVVWNSSFNFSLLRNEVTDLGDEEYVTSYSDFTGLNKSIPEFIYKVGEPLGSIWGLKYIGPWKESEAEEAAKYGMSPGDARYEDLNGDYKFDGNDCQIIGHGMPKHTLGWNNTVTWKNFTVNAFFQGVVGVDKLNYTRMMGMRAADDVRAATFAEAKERYIPGVQEDTYLPAWSPTSDWIVQSSMTLEDASFLRLKNLSVSYDFNVRKIGRFAVSFNATNLFTITKYKGLDPEASNLGGGTSDIMQGVDYGAYPNSRTFTLGLDMTF